MASLSDQIDRLTRNTRAIKTTAANIAPASSNNSPIFTAAVLTTHLGDLIRDVDPSELGLFRLVQNPSDIPYEFDGRVQPEIRRIEFPGATPLRKHASRREEGREIEPEVYALAALKYIEQYQPIRPMPRAYDQILAVLDKLERVRSNMKSLNVTLEKVSTAEKVPPTKVRVEQEEQRIKDLQARVAELSKKKEPQERARRPQEKKKEIATDATPPTLPVSPLQEDKFWTTSGEPSRILRFTDNLLDEEVNLEDMTSASFGSPLTGSSEFKPLKLFGDISITDDEISPPQTMPLSQPAIEEDTTPENTQHERKSYEIKHVEITASPDPPVNLHTLPLRSVPENEEKPNITTAGSTTRQRKIKVDEEVERIVSKIWSTVGEILPPPNPAPTSTATLLSVEETLLYLQTLSTQTPALDSPIASTVSSLSGEGVNTPTFQQIQIAHLLTMLLLATPNYSMSLHDVKETLTLKAKSSGVAVVGQSATRVLYNCIAKRLVKIDRGGREQVVKFDI